MPETNCEPEWLSFPKAAQYLEMSTATFAKLVKQGQVSVRAIPGLRPKVAREELKRFVAETTRKMTPSS